MLRICTFILLLCIIFINFKCNNDHYYEIEKSSLEYYSKYRIKLTGKIVSIKDIDSRNCFIKILIDTANTKNHDLRFSSERYYLYIKQDTAYAIECCKQSLFINQRVLIDYTKNKTYSVDEDNNAYSNPLPVITEQRELLQRQYLNGL
jgi:hypothetical protein